MFTPKHFIWIGMCIVLIAILLFISLKFKFKKKTALYIMCGITVASELLKLFTNIIMVYDEYGNLYRGFIDPKALPLHLCSFFIFIFFFMLFNKNEELEKKIISFFVPIGLIGAILAILFATTGVEFTSPITWQNFIYHAGMIYLALYYMITKQVDLGLKAYIRNLIILCFLVIVMIWVNGALSAYDTNYFFVCRPPAKNLPFLNLKSGWHIYFLRIVFCGLLFETIICLPYIIKEKKNKKALPEAPEESPSNNN